MKTPFEYIVHENFIGSADNPTPMGELFEAACREELPPVSGDKKRTMLLAVDVQHDFMDGGALGVSGSCSDVARLTRFIYDNVEHITTIAVTLDTHSPQQIFHACWWRGADGNPPSPYTIITKADLESGRWTPSYEPKASAEYLEHLEAAGRKKLCIWPYHCLEGTSGCALENQFANMLHFYSFVRDSKVRKVVKGRIPATEFYGVIRPEYSPDGIYTNSALLDEIAACDRLVIAGEAMDYCVYESARQIMEGMESRGHSPELFVLTDCMSSIQPREAAEALYAGLLEKFKFKMVSSTEKFL